MADEGSRKRGLEAAENSDEDEEDDMIGPMPAPPPKPKKKRGKCKIKYYCKSLQGVKSFLAFTLMTRG